MKRFILGLLGAIVTLAPFTQVIAEEAAATKPKYLYKVVSEEEWQASLEKKEVELSAMDKDFIHLATEDQVPHVIQKFWSGKKPLVLKLTTDKLVGRLAYEQNPGGNTKYYHLYEGAIPIDAVVEINDETIL
jgi:uncharacterized protein (DUF952 family)